MVSAMWLPKPIYEGLPAIYIVAGVLFLFGASYLGFAHATAPLYAGTGAVCILSGLLVWRLRSHSRDGRSPKSTADDAVEK